MSAYWYVYNPDGFGPRYRHVSAESAIAESRRLAQENPSIKFEVLKCIGWSRVEPKPDIFHAFDPSENQKSFVIEDGIPF